MLTEEDKQRIRAEEIYRQVAREEITAAAKTASTNGRLWSVLNSAFFLWFLTTVAVGSITAVWSHYQSNLAEQRQERQRRAQKINDRLDRIKHLDLEISGRLSQFLVDVEPMVKTPYDARYSLKRPYTIEDIRKTWHRMKMPPKYNPEANIVYSEFADRGIVSLIVELSSLVKNAKQEGEIVGIAKPSGTSEVLEQDLRQVATDIQDDIIFFGNASQNEFLPIYQRFNKLMMLRRWEDEWPYMDCGPQSPFC